MHKNKSMKPENYGNYKVDNNKIIYVDPDDKEEKVISDHVKIKEILQNIETNEIKLILEYWYHNRMHEMEISRQSLSKYEIRKLLKYGVDVYEHKADRVAHFLSIQETYAPKEYMHSHLGWAVHEDSPIYKHDHIISSEEQFSRYDGELTLESSGTYDEWQSIIEEEVLGVTTLELALVFGFSSVVVGYLAQEIDLDSLVIHIWGDSTKGKTTAAKLVVSPFGKPTTSQGGLLHTWNGTPNSLINKLANNRGIPFVLDESSMGNINDFTKMIYQLAGGIEKSRLTKEAKQRERQTWATTIISTAEKSLLSNASQNIGQMMRLFEFDNITWTRDAMNADNLRHGVESHYGHAGPLFAKYLLEQEEGYVKEKWKAWSQTLFNQMQEVDRFSDRIANKLSLLLVTADLVREALNIPLNIDGISNLLIQQNQQSQGSRDIGENALEAIKAKIYEHNSKFEKEHPPGDLESNGYECWGRIKKGGKFTEVYILPHKFRELLMECGFEDERVVLADWKQKKYIKHDSGTYQKKTSIKKIDEDLKHNDGRVKTYCILLPKDALSVKETKQLPARKRPVPSQKGNDSQLKNMLEGKEGGDSNGI